MNHEIFCPKPVRPHKRLLSDFDPETAPARKHRRRNPPYLPSANDQPFRTLHSISAPPLSPRSRNRNPEHCESKDPRLRSSFIDSWLSGHTSNRPSSCAPAIFIGADTCSSHGPVPLEVIERMSQRRYAESPGPGSGNSQNSRPGTSHALYRGSLYNNFVVLDCSGRKLPQELKEYANTQILKQRESPQLDNTSVFKVIGTAEELADSTEGPTMKLIRTPMFPLEHLGIAEGGNSTWNTTALPNNPEYEYDLSAPKPDAYFGYPNNQRSGWSYAQSNVINHPVARPYVQPGRGPTFPSLMVEIKSEPAGGTLYVAENQAAGSGSYAVNAMLWLLKEAGHGDSLSMKDTIAFTITASHRQAIFYIHWYSPEDSRFYMSYLKSYSPVEPADIRACNNTVKNILDLALGSRKTVIGNALQALFPFPAHWKQARPASTTPSTPATSFSEDAGSNKNKRRQLEHLETKPPAAKSSSGLNGARTFDCSM